MDDASRFAKRKLQTASQTKDTARRLAIALGTSAAVLSALLAIALLDYWFALPIPLRIAGLAGLATLAGLGVYKLLQSLRTPSKLKEAALDVEKLKPEIGCELSTAAEYLAGDRTPTQEYEKELAAALEKKAADTLKQIELPYLSRPFRPAILLGTAIFAVGLFLALASGSLTALERTVTPWSDIRYTRVQVTPGDLELPLGRNAEIRSTFSGRIPARPELLWQTEGASNWHSVALTRSTNGAYLHTITNVQAALNYRVAGGDAISAAYKLQPYIPPEVNEWRIQFEYPAYTRRPKETQNTPGISVLRGTTTSVRINPSVELASARVQFTGRDPFDLVPEDGLWKFDFVIATNTEFRLELKDRKGHLGGNETAYQVQALPDTPPKVEINEPGQDTRAEATNTIPVRISVADDFGLDEIRLVFNKLGDPEQIITAKRTGQTNSSFTAAIPLSTLNLQEYELVAYHAEATDNNTLDGPGIGKSEVYFIEITNEEGGACKSQGSGQRVNLLVLQKQIIADTTALASKSDPARFNDLAQRQQDAIDFGQMYLGGMRATGAAAEATSEMQAAVEAMQTAHSSLSRHDRTGALKAEENALGRLYAVLKQMPELQNLPTTPARQENQTNESPTVNVVLDAIRKQKKEEPDTKEAAEALARAQELQRQQESLAIGSRNSASGSGSGENQLDRSGAEPKDDAGKKQQVGKTPTGMADKERQLSKEAAALAEKLARLQGKNSRLGQSAGNKISQAANDMAAAADAMGRGDMQTAGTKGSEIGESLSSAIALLDRIVNDRPDRADVSKEEFPKEYENLINAYLKKLSYEE